ncbi:HNH endonuclease [Microbulbifer harenosus]|uniref:HNH endonuclease n=1 Tax=Microbulbifer harenosus TaxID=2576840 RepID=A0ABY2UKN3_9GAMM|nr:hypothetical protein [Microbulbifer harenosus]TLM78600.1 hypothetical protein FDY93_04870 [Microbulbifer harenosus]
MKIESPIEYSSESRLLVDQYESDRESQSHEYWYHEDIAEVKREIKSHYKNEQSLTCVYCNIRYPVQHSGVWDVEHIVARKNSPQFMFTPKNLCVACKDCNTEKSNKHVLVNKGRLRYPTESHHFTIVHPHFDVYEDHIAVHLGIIYAPKSDKGRKTIEACGLLRFSYNAGGWNESVAQVPGLIETANAMLNEEDEAERDRLKMQMLMLAQIQVSNSLLVES